MGESHFPRAPTEAANLCKSLKEELKSAKGDSVYNSADRFKKRKMCQSNEAGKRPHGTVTGTVGYLESGK